VRELQNVIERSVIVCETDEFIVDESWLTIGPPAAHALALPHTIAAHERAVIEDALRVTAKPKTVAESQELLDSAEMQRKLL